MEKCYRFAGIDLIIRIPDDRMYRNGLNLKNFQSARAENPHRYAVSVVPQLPVPSGPELAVMPGIRIYGTDGGYCRYQGPEAPDEQGAYACGIHRGRDHELLVKEDMVSDTVSARLVLNGLDVEHLVASSGGLILHSSYIEWQEQGIVFTAPSGTGKSTQAELWRTLRGSRILNGDRVVLLEGENGITAAGLPFSGSSEYCENRTLPLAAVVYLRQAPETSIRTLRGREAFRRIWEGISVNTWNRADMEQTVTLTEKLLAQVPVYELACTPDESAVLALEQALNQLQR